MIDNVYICTSGTCWQLIMVQMNYEGRSYSEMEWFGSLLACLSASLLAVFLLVFSWIKVQNGDSPKNRPPGPPGWPVVGNMFDLGEMPHRTFYKLGAKYGSVLWLKLGSVNTLVIHSEKAAAELFKNHDLPFSDRKVPDSLTALGFNQRSLSFSNYGEYWRLIGRLSATELMGNKRVKESAPLRQKCVDNMIRWIEEEATASRLQGGSGQVTVVRFLFRMAFNIVGNLMLSRDLLDMQSDEGQEFIEATNKFMEWSGKPNMADSLPFLKWLDPQGIKRNTMQNTEQCMKIISTFIEERIHEKQFGSDDAKKDFLNVLLEYQGDGKEGPREISRENVNIIILEMFFGGSDTVSNTIEWVMAELLRNPHSMTKVREELDLLIGTNRKVKESDIDGLFYLQAVVKETVRLHPPLPSLVPRNATEDTNYMEYLIPKNTQVFVNAWAIGRDPNSWDDPLSFKPERFLNSDTEYKGHHFELIPFGAGRRICVALPSAHRVINHTIASLLQAFDWELDSYVTPETIVTACQVNLSP